MIGEHLGAMFAGLGLLIALGQVANGIAMKHLGLRIENAILKSAEETKAAIALNSCARKSAGSATGMRVAPRPRLARWQVGVQSARDGNTD